VIEVLDSKTSEVQIFTTNGSKIVYEESFDGTNAGWEKFRKDITSASGVKGNFDIEVKESSSTYTKLTKGEDLNPYLESDKVTVRVISLTVNKTKNSKKKPKKEKDLEMGDTSNKSDKKSNNKSSSNSHDDSSTGCSCCKIICFPCRLVLLFLIYAFLFVFWVLALLVSFIIELFWCPFKCICPLCCPCFCCLEEIEKEVFGLFFYILKAPFRLAKKILS